MQTGVIDMLRLKKNARGFTIVELMIALSILSFLLLSSTVILIQIGNLYTKGVNSANTQDVTRNIVNDFATQIEQSGNTPDLSYYGSGVGQSLGISSPSAFCVGNERYTFLLNHMQTGAQTGTAPFPISYHSLWRDSIAGGASCQPVANFTSSLTPSDAYTVGNSGVELLPLNNRLTDFLITGPSANGTYYVDVGLAYGADDLLCNNTTANDCNTTATSTTIVPHAINETIMCKGLSGSQFCAVSRLKIVVERRIVNN